jgi:hypothetical protein
LEEPGRGLRRVNAMRWQRPPQQSGGRFVFARANQGFRSTEKGAYGRKRGAVTDEWLGRSRGGITSKIHLCLEGHGCPCRSWLRLGSAVTRPRSVRCSMPSVCPVPDEDVLEKGRLRKGNRGGAPARRATACLWFPSSYLRYSHFSSYCVAVFTEAGRFQIASYIRLLQHIFQKKHAKTMSWRADPFRSDAGTPTSGRSGDRRIQ